MLSQVQNFIHQQALFHQGDKLILACSGGKDSMALLHLLQQMDVELVVAHCNFKLREEESDADEKFVVELCQDRKIKCRTVSFETEALSQAQHCSIQEMARELRYTWLSEVRQEEQAKCILTAHHLQDNIETLLFKLAKGTGLKGIRGMLPKQGHVVRPLLNTPLDEILNYIAKYKLKYREDSSNITEKYDRNLIRHQIISPLNQINPNLSDSFANHFSRWRDIEQMHAMILAEWKRKLIKSREGSFFIAIRALEQYQFNKSLLFELLGPYGFNNSDVDDVLNGLHSPETKEYLSKDFRLIKDRQFLVLTALSSLQEAKVHTISRKKKKIKLGNHHHLSFNYKPIVKLSKIDKSNTKVYIDTAKLTFPLLIRKWKTGDYFYPIGFTKSSGKPSKKNIAKFLRDEKVGAFDKANTWVLLSNEKIVWVLGHRADERFKIDEKTKEVLAITMK